MQLKYIEVKETVVAEISFLLVEQTETHILVGLFLLWIWKQSSQ